MLHVVVAIIKNSNQEVLVALRSPDSHQGNLWEFPGGKLELAETVFSALQREICEEIGLRIRAAYPFIKILHDYGDKQVLLDVWQVTKFDGEASGREGQKIKWLAPKDMESRQFPEANHRIINLLQLPTQMAITPQFEIFPQLSTYLGTFEHPDAQAVQIRQKHLTHDQLLDWTHRSLEILSGCGPRLILNGPFTLEKDLPSEVGLHLTSTELGRLQGRMGESLRLVGCSCHSREELTKAEALGFDYALLSPVASTVKYPNKSPLGWSGFEELAASVSLPVYALGGMKRSDVRIALKRGAAGVAGIGAFDKLAG
jgi:8-oxo-dGTP diphosphatase